MSQVDLVRLTLLDEQELAQDPHPDMPFRLEFRGWWRHTLDGGVESATLELRLAPEDLSDVMVQAHAQQLAHVTRLRRQTADEQEARARAAQAAVDPTPADTDLLTRVLEGLRRYEPQAAA